MHSTVPQPTNNRLSRTPESSTIAGDELLDLMDRSWGLDWQQLDLAGYSAQRLGEALRALAGRGVRVIVGPTGLRIVEELSGDR